MFHDRLVFFKFLKLNFFVNADVLQTQIREIQIGQEVSLEADQEAHEPNHAPPFANPTPPEGYRENGHVQPNPPFSRNYDDSIIVRI